MAITKEDILEAVGGMTVMDLNDLVKAFEEKFGVSAAAMSVAGPAAAANPVRCERRSAARPSAHGSIAHTAAEGAAALRVETRACAGNGAAPCTECRARRARSQELE